MNKDTSFVGFTVEIRKLYERIMSSMINIKNLICLPKYFFVIKTSHFFDPIWYKETYLRGLKANPVLHYLDHGTEMEVNPSKNFSTKEYYLANPDVEKVGMNALLHYELFGKYEGREIIRYDRLLKRFDFIRKIKKNSEPYPKKHGKDSNIKIFVACKEESYVPDNPLLFPIQTGTTLSNQRFSKMLHDDQGDNISDRNDYYCELTAQYWAWKNVEADYYGLFHNRRYLSFNNKKLWEENNVGIEFESIDSYAVDRLYLYEEHMRRVIEGYDIIVPRPFNWLEQKELGINRTVLHQYEMSKEHYVTDLITGIGILKRRYPESSSIADRYLHSPEGYQMNIFVMRKEIFFDYCEWLFPVLDEIYETLDLSNRSQYGKRAIGFIGERLLGVYLNYLYQERPDLRIWETQNSLFKSLEPPLLNQQICREKKDIKIFVSHRIDLESETIDNPLYYPVRCGAVFDDKPSEIPGDDTGDNISEKRLSYNELTVQYWAWKNFDADYYGLCHYRRFLSFSDIQFEEVDVYNHIIEKQIDSELITRHNLDEITMRYVIEQYDAISLLPMDLNRLEKGLTVYKSLEKNPNVFNMKGVDLFIDTFKEMYPDYSQDIDDYFNGNIWRGFNCFILKKELFIDYSEHLFNVLFKFEKKLDYSKFNQEQWRLVGLMGECMFAIYYNHLKKLGYKTKELQLIKIENPQKRLQLEPAFKENNIAVMMASSNEYVPFLNVLLQSIIENMSIENNYDFIIVSDGISDSGKEILEKFVAPFRNLSIRFIDSQTYLNGRNLFTRMHLVPLTYIRLAVPEILSKYKKAIYLDCDIVINTDIADLYNKTIDEYMVAAVVDTVMAGMCNMMNNDQADYNKNILGLRKEVKYFNAGVLLLNIEEFNSKYTSEELFRIAESYNWRWFDQDILNILCEGKVLYLDSSWNFMAHPYFSHKQLPEFYAPKSIYDNYLKVRVNPKAIHYAGHFLPCFAPNVDLADYFWHYARQTVFYEKILSIMMHNIENTHYRARVKSRDKSRLYFSRRVADYLFPTGTTRREFVKKVLPKKLIH